MKISYKEYVHASQHVPMGCGPVYECELCKNPSMGDIALIEPTSIPTSTTPPVAVLDANGNEIPFITWTQVMQTVVVAIIGALASEVIVRRFLIKKLYRDEGKAKSNPNKIVKTKRDKKAWRKAVRITQNKFGKKKNHFSKREWSYTMGAFQRMRS